MPFRSKKNTKKVLIESKLGNLPRGRGWEVFNHHAVSGPGTRWLKCNWWRKTLMTQSQSKLTLLPPNPPLSRSPKSRRPPPPPPPPPLPLVCSTRILLPSRSFPSRSLTTSSASRRSSNSANPNPSWKQNQCHSKVKRPRLLAPLIIFHLLIPWQRCSWFFHSPWGTSQYPWQELGQHLDVEIKLHLGSLMLSKYMLLKKSIRSGWMDFIVPPQLWCKTPLWR